MEQYKNRMARDMYLDYIIGETLRFMEAVFARWISQKRVKDHDVATLAAEYQYPIFSMTAEYEFLRFDGKDTTDIERRLDKHVSFFESVIQLPSTQSQLIVHMVEYSVLSKVVGSRNTNISIRTKPCKR